MWLLVGSSAKRRHQTTVGMVENSDFMLLQRVSIACYAERCTSYDKSFRPSVRPSYSHIKDSETTNIMYVSSRIIFSSIPA